MKKEIIELKGIYLVGITCRTNTKAEMNQSTAKIGVTAQRYFSESLHDKIDNRKNPGTTYCVYTEYESDFSGDYTYFIGEEVNSFDSIGDVFQTLTIPAQYYAKFTNGPSQMPEVCIDAWRAIWNMDDKDLGGKRNYIADFEVYDERSRDPQNAILDIYVGIKK